MGQIIPFKRSAKTRELVYRAANELFEGRGIDYEDDYFDIHNNPESLLELVTGATKQAVIQETQEAYDRAIEVQSSFRDLWHRRSVGRKISDLLKGRRLEKVLPQVLPYPEISHYDFKLHDRSFNGSVYIGHNQDFERSLVSVNDRYLNGTLIVAGQKFELDPSDRLIRVQMIIRRSDTIRYDSRVTHTVYPDSDQVSTEFAKIHGTGLENVSYLPTTEESNGLLTNMLHAIEGLNLESS